MKLQNYYLKADRTFIWIMENQDELYSDVFYKMVLLKNLRCKLFITFEFILASSKVIEVFSRKGIQITHDWKNILRNASRSSEYCHSH